MRYLLTPKPGTTTTGGRSDAAPKTRHLKSRPTCPKGRRLPGADRIRSASRSCRAGTQMAEGRNGVRNRAAASFRSIRDGYIADVGNELNGKKIAFLVANEGVEEVELSSPWEAVQDAGGEPFLVAPKTGEVQTFNH